MEEIISLVIANGLWAVLFCGLLVYQLRDGRTRELKYTQTIRALSDRLNEVMSVKADTTEIRADAKSVLADTTEIKAAVAKPHGGRGGKVCASTQL